MPVDNEPKTNAKRKVSKPLPAGVLADTARSAAAIPAADFVPAIDAMPIVSAQMPAEHVSPPAAIPAAPIVKDIAMNETVNTIENNVNAAAAETSDTANEMFHDMQGKAKAAFEKSGDVMKDVVEFHKANLEAVVESGKLAAKGSQTAMQNAVDYGKKNWEATTAHAKTVSGVRAPADFVKAQSEFARSQFDAMIAEFTKSSEFTMKMMGEVMQPIQNRAAAVAEQMKTRMAA